MKTMTDTPTPGVFVNETSIDPNANGNGGEIPIFIGISGNETPATGVKRFTGYDEAKQTIANGGIGTNTTNNYLLDTLKEFFEESKLINDDTDNLGVPYVYVIDLGAASIAGENPTTTSWTNAISLAKTVDAQSEVYVGFKSTDATATILSIMASVASSLDTELYKGKPREAYYTVFGMTDANLKTLIKNTVTSQKSKTALIEPEKFGKHVARIATTPHYIEPGYLKFRSVSPGEFPNRTDADETALMNAGVIFGRDEHYGEIYPKICLGVSTAYAADPKDRVNDSLLHYRRNVNQLIRDAVVEVYPQLKNNQFEGSMQILQTKVNTLINKKIKSNEMQDGTFLNVSEVVRDDVDGILLSGKAKPIKATHFIDINTFLER